MPNTLLDFYYSLLDEKTKKDPAIRRYEPGRINITPGYRSPDVEDGRNVLTRQQQFDNLVQKLEKEGYRMNERGEYEMPDPTNKLRHMMYWPR